MATRLALVRISAIGAETRGHSVSAAIYARGVFPDGGVIAASARSDHASMTSRWHIAVRHAVSIPLSHSVSRSAGVPPARSPPATPIASGVKTALLPSLAEMHAASDAVGAGAQTGRGALAVC